MDINKEQILVVDDEEDLRKAIVDILTLDGYEVDQAGSAEEAAEKLEQSSTARQLLGDEFVDHYVRTRKWEVRQFQRAVTDWELERYFEII